MTDTYSGAGLFAMLNAPICATSKRWPRVLHAAELDELVPALYKGRTITAPCGAAHLRPLADQGVVVLWPPPFKCAPLRRCRECWIATGRKRPRPGRSIYGRAS